jgi:hypothetical protein
MRSLWKACATASVILLAGCEAPEVHYTIAGLKAFRAGDKPALEKAQAELTKLNPTPAVAPAPCSREDFGQRRAKTFSDLLGFLDNQWADSDTENLRYFRLQATLRTLIMDDLPPVAEYCPPSSERDLQVVTDTSERTQVAAGLRDVMVPWGASLGHLPIPHDSDELAREMPHP